MSKLRTSTCASSERESLGIRKPRARRFQNLAVVVCAIFVAFLCAEFFVRLFATQDESWLEIYRPHPTLTTYSLKPDIQKVIDTGETRWTCRTDANGLRVAGNPSRKPVGDVVLCLGDSFTFGHGVDYEQAFVGRLDSDQDLPFRFINAGVPGYGPVQYEQLLEHHLEQGLHPAQVVVTVFLGNDFFDCVWDKDLAVVDGAIASHGSKPKNLLKRYSHLYRIASKGYHILAKEWSTTDDIERKMIDPTQWEAEELSRARRRFKASFASISETCRRENIPLHVVLIPMLITVAEAGKSDRAEPDAKYWLPNLYATKIFDELGIDSIDLTPLYLKHPIKETFFAFDHHLTPKGHRIASDEIKHQMKRAYGQSTWETQTKTAERADQQVDLRFESQH